MIDQGVVDLSGVMSEAIEQVTKGKGNERHGGGAALYDQPWVAIANSCGTGFLTGQAIKKTMEAAMLMDSEGYSGAQFERELLGAMNYLAFAIMHRRLEDGKNAD